MIEKAPMNYFRLKDDIYASDHSALGEIKCDGKAVDADSFTAGIKYAYDATKMHEIDGEVSGEFDFNLASFDVPIISRKFAQILRSLGEVDCQMIPVKSRCGGSFYILNAMRRVKCLDESKSLFTKWDDSDGRPDRTGQYRMVAELKIEPILAEGLDVFRIEGWDVPLVVSGRLVSILQAQGMKGCVYELIC